MNLFAAVRAVLGFPARRMLNYPAVSATHSRFYCDKAGNKSVAGATPSQESIPQKGRLGLTDHHVNRLEKYFLVWSGKYKTIKDVPDLVNQDVMERARNKARIKISAYMCVATLLGCLAMVYSGKKAQERGDSVAKMNKEFHEKYEANLAQAKAAKN